MKLKSRKKGDPEQILPLVSDSQLLINKASCNYSCVWSEVSESNLCMSLSHC